MCQSVSICVYLWLFDRKVMSKHEKSRIYDCIMITFIYISILFHFLIKKYNIRHKCPKIKFDYNKSVVFSSVILCIVKPEVVLIFVDVKISTPKTIWRVYHQNKGFFFKLLFLFIVWRYTTKSIKIYEKILFLVSSYGYFVDKKKLNKHEYYKKVI